MRKPMISVWAAKTWKTAGKTEEFFRDGNSFCVIGAAAYAKYGNLRRGTSPYRYATDWHGSGSDIVKLVRFNNRPETTKAQVLAYARRLGL